MGESWFIVSCHPELFGCAALLIFLFLVHVLAVDV